MMTRVDLAAGDKQMVWEQRGLRLVKVLVFAALTHLALTFLVPTEPVAPASPAAPAAARAAGPGVSAEPRVVELRIRHAGNSDGATVSRRP